jgi:2-methylcitrate dehydratase PrpD
MNGNQRVARFIGHTKWQDVPAEAQHMVKLSLLDALGAALSGTLAGISDISSRFVAQGMQGDSATLLLQNTRATAAGAAFFNANAANAFDSDDDNPMVWGHIGATLIPAALAVAEKYSASGEALLTALAVGYEVAFRTGRCWHDHHETWRAAGSWGSVPNAAAAAHLMGLNEEPIENALGIAEYHAPLIPIERDLAQPAMVKHGMGWGAINGIMAAELAQLGYTGVPGILGFEKYAEWVADIGKTYLISTVQGFKEITGCAYGHQPIYALREIRKTRDFNADEVEHVLIETHEHAILLPSAAPTNTEQAQFSIVWPLACELLYREYGPHQQMEPILSDSVTRAMLGKIELVEDQEFNRLYHLTEKVDHGGSFNARVTVTLKNGTRPTATNSLTSFGHQLSQTQLEEKFRWLCKGVLSDERIDALIEMIMDLEQVDQIDQLTALVQ